MPVNSNGGYSKETEQLRKNKLKQYDPTGGYNFINWIASNFFGGNQAKGEENEHYIAYMGFPNNLPGMNPKAKTEWDDKIEKEKADKGEPLSDFYGTTPRMDQNIQAMADTLNLGKIYRNYDEYKAKEPNLPSKNIIEWNYKTGKQILENPGKWVQVDGAVGVKNQYEKDINETNPLGMLEDFGAKWVPEEGALYMHDTYDFSNAARWATGIPIRPKEMKIRGRIGFDPKKGSFLLRDDLKNFNSGYAKPVVNRK